MPPIIYVDLREDELRAVLALVGPRVSETNEEGTPLERAERKLDGALLYHETREAAANATD